VDYYREADLGRFTRIGLITIVVLGAAAWFFYDHAGREVRADNRGPYERRGGIEALAAGDPMDAGSTDARIQNRLQGQGAQQPALRPTTR
jgi:hypothetical protein